METELLKPDDLVTLLDDPSFKELSFPERKQAGEMALQEASQWMAQNGGWTPESFRDFGEAAKGFREEIAQSETMWESAKGVANVIGQTVADSVKVLGLTAADAVTVTDPSSSWEDLRFKAPGGSVLPSLARGTAAAADAADVTVTALKSTADNAVDDELAKLRADIDEGKMPLDREALNNWLQERSDDIAEKQAYWYHDRRALPPPTAEEMREVGWAERYQARLQAEEVSEETARAAYAQSIMQDPVSARLLAGYMQTRNPELIDQLSSRLKTDPRTQALRDENEKARDADGLAKFLKANFGEEAAQLLDEAGDPMEWAGTVFAPLKGAKAIQRGRKAMNRAIDLAQGVGGEMLSEQGSLQVEDPFATLERRREVARDTFFGALGLMGAGAGVKKLVGGKDAAASADPADVVNAPSATPSIEGELPGAPPTAPASQVEVDGTAWQYDPARITPDALRAAAPETLAALQQAGIIQPPPVATPSVPVSSDPTGAPVPGQTATPWAPPASARVATPSVPVPSVPGVTPVPGQPATPWAPPASAPVAPPSAPVSAAPDVTSAPGQPATPPVTPASAPVAPPSAPVSVAPGVTSAPGQPATPPVTPASAPVATPSAPVSAAPDVTSAPGQPATPPVTPASAPVATPSAPVSAAPGVTSAPGQPATPPVTPASAPVATPSAASAAVPNVTTTPAQPATPPPPPITARTMDAVVAWADGVIQASRGRMNAGLDPVLLTAHAVKAIEAGVNFATWAADMVRQFGEGARQFLQSAWQSAQPARSWPANFPNVTPMSTGSAVIAHPLHAAAKAGDRVAAAKLVMALAKPAKLRALAQQHPSAIVVPVHAEESTGRNQIPRKFADYFGYVTGLEVDTGIVQSRKVGRTGKGAWYRLAFRPAFSGPVQAGREYIVVDDIVTGGGSLSELRQFIESQGGRVVAMSTLGYAQYSTVLALSAKTRLDLVNKFGETQLREFLASENLYGGEVGALTESEARTLLRAGSLDSARDRIFEAGQQSLIAAQPGVFSAARPPSRAQVLAARGIVGDGQIRQSRAATNGSALNPRNAAATARGAMGLLESASPGITAGARVVTNRDQLNREEFTTEEWAALNQAEGLFNPRTGQAVVILDNVGVRQGESPTRAIARVLLHERIGHEGLAALRQSDPAFAQRWNALVREVMADEAIMAELRAIAADPAYAELGGDPSLLVEEWFARQAEQLTDAELAALKPSSLLAKLWQALKNALAKMTGRFARPQWTAREVREILALSRQALARGESAATRPPGPLRLSAPPSSPGMHPSQFGERVQVDPRLTPEMRAAPVTEFPIQRQQDIHNQARDVIRQQGLAAALATFRNDTTLPIPLRIAGLMQVAQNFDAQSLAARATNDPARVAEADQFVEAAVEAKVALETIGNEAGRNLAMFNTWARLSPDGMLARLERKLAKANETNPQIPATIPAAMRPKLQQMATAAMALPEGVLRTAVMADLMAEFSMIEGIKTSDLWWSVWYSNVLAGLATQSVNVLGSTENVLLSVVELGTLNPRSLAAYLRGLVRGMKQGTVEAWSVLKGGPLIKPGKWVPQGPSGLELLARQGGPQTNFSNVREGAQSLSQWAAYIASLGGVSRFVGRLLGGMDAFFYYTSHEGAAAVAIQRALRKAGIKPGTPQFRQEVIRQMGGDPAQYQADLQQARAELQAAGRPITKRDIMRRAWELVRERREQGASIEAANWAARAVYQDELQGSGRWVSGLITQMQRLPLAGRLVVPFNQILSSMFRRGLDYTGLGLARGLLGYSLMDLAAPPATGRVRMTPMERRQRAVAGVVGPVVAVAVAAYASQFKEEDDEDIRFWIYDSGPKDKTRRRQMPKGWQPYSIKVGGRYIRYSETPLGPMLAAVAGWLNAERYTQPDTIARRTNEQKLGIALQAAVAQYSDLGVLSGIAELMDVVTGNERLDKAFQDKGARSLSGLVPLSGLMREIETLFDPTKIHADTVLESLQRDIPIVSGWGTKPDLNAFSEPLTEPGLPVVKRFMTKQKEDPNWTWVRRNGLKIPAVDLNEQLEIGRYLLPNEAQGTKLKDIYAARGWALAAADNGLLTREQRYQFAKRTGELMKERIIAVRKSMEAGPTGGVIPAAAQIQKGNRMVLARDVLQTDVQTIFEASRRTAMKEVIDMMVK